MQKEFMVKGNPYDTLRDLVERRTKFDRQELLNGRVPKIAYHGAGGVRLLFSNLRERA
jgi:hypothetical protein